MEGKSTLGKRDSLGGYHDNTWSVGMIIRDDQGHLMVARTTWREQCMQVYEGEAWSLLVGLK
ncbi:hypothetical protein JHK86_025104 [Glycine max]|nr:hypothetical protein JHK86_025104 [Glycine max]